MHIHAVDPSSVCPISISYVVSVSSVPASSPTVGGGLDDITNVLNKAYTFLDNVPLPVLLGVSVVGGILLIFLFIMAVISTCVVM